MATGQVAATPAHGVFATLRRAWPTAKAARNCATAESVCSGSIAGESVVTVRRTCLRFLLGVPPGIHRSPEPCGTGRSHGAVGLRVVIEPA